MTSQTVPALSVDAGAIRARARPLTGARVAFIDNLRVLLVVLVVVFHLAITYGGEGPWQYAEGRADMVTATLLTLFVAVNQAFFMGFYFLISAYFVPRSLERKGGKQFLKERLVRLGVPLALQLLVVGPLLSYGLGITIWGYRGSFWSYVGAYWKGYECLDVGPLWFVEALLYFSLAYALWWRLAKPSAARVSRECAAPGNGTIALFALVVGLITYAVRIWLPVGWAFAPLGFQFPHFPQYVALFAVGTIAYRRRWLAAISEDPARGRLWGRTLVVLVAMAPVLFALGGALEGNTDAFRGGLHWQAVAYAVWEQFVCVAMVISLLVLFCRRFDRQSRLGREMSRSAYGAYVYHAPILIAVALALRSVELHALLKFGLASMLCVPICFAVGGLVRRIPFMDRVL